VPDETDPIVLDVGFLDSPAAREEQRRAAVGQALRYARQLGALADEYLDEKRGYAYSKSPEGQRAAPFVAAVACLAFATVGELLDPRAWPQPDPAAPDGNGKERGG
jgi:hypothetical protein